MAAETDPPLNDDQSSPEAPPKVTPEASAQVPQDASSELASEFPGGVAVEEPVASAMVSRADAEASGIDLLHDVNLQVTIELGRAQMYVEDVLRLGEGSVVELDKLAGDPVDVYVNQRLVARGEVLVLNDNFCIRISEIVADLEEEAEALAAESAPAV